MKYSLIRFLRNIIYLARYNLKDLNNNSLTYIKHRYNFAAKIRNEIKNDFDILKPPRVKGVVETMKELVGTNKSIIRFGDGEYIIMGGMEFHFKNTMKNWPINCQRLFYIITMICL
ncbi:hypothetical protein [Helicobacter trogontum]|uniref:Uncharacterized protein n=1 Tax=Helicobacter trogontum TaxID=50960 RepID=A0A099VE10_9HELI|nr:hypothetical protein [Helicobacter trogontum]TLD84691.1 hypothetical protein LS81_001400 [Helicobacter trogontum]